MPMNATLLGTTIKNTLLALNPDSGLLNGTETTKMEVAWQAIAQDFETHYETLMDVLPNTFQTTDATHENHGASEPVTGLGKVT
jgi:hypothetical protein